MSFMLLAALGAAAISALLASCWRFILNFLNGPVRDLLERTFGATKCAWYTNFLLWCDKKISASKRIIKMQWAKFKDTVLYLKSKYTKNPDGTTYTKRQETFLRLDENKARHIVTEETVPASQLPPEIRKLLERDNEIDDRNLFAQKLQERAKEEGLDLTT